MPLWMILLPEKPEDPEPPEFSASGNEFSLRFPPDLFSVRSAISLLMSWCSEKRNSNTCGDIEIVLAEVLNNTVEYGGLHSHQCISLHAVAELECLKISITDDGHPYPEAKLEGASFPHAEDLPEGGFGWGLIHRLASKIEYQRRNGENSLEIVFDQQVTKP